MYHLSRAEYVTPLCGAPSGERVVLPEDFARLARAGWKVCDKCARLATDGAGVGR